MIRSIDVAVLPVEAGYTGGDCFVVIDVLRATTVIAVLFERGLRELTAMDNLEAARVRASATGALLLGEVDGLAPPGFDAGNSPVEAGQLAVAGRDAVHFTTNGTRALVGVGALGPVVVGGAANSAAVCASVAERYERVVIVAAGNGAGMRFSLEDFAAAGIFVRLLREAAPGAEAGDAAVLAGSLAPSLIGESRHAGLLRGLGLGADVEFAMREGTSTAVPVVSAIGPGWATIRRAD